MKKTTLIQRIQNIFRPQQKLDEEVIHKFITVLEKVRTDETTCTEMYAQLDEFVETQVKTKDAARLMPLLREHLDICSDCCDEYEALLTVIENTQKQ